MTAFLFTLAIKPTYAQEQPAVSLGIYPPVLEISADPPAQPQAKITIQNLKEDAQDLTIQLRSFRPSEAGNGQIEYLNTNKIEGPDPLILQKIQILDGDQPVDKITLDPLSQKELTLQVNLEAGAPKGDYYFSVIFVSDSKAGQDISSSTLPAGIGTNVILSVGKKGEIKGQIVDFSAPFLVSRGPIPFTLLLKNTGDQYIIPSGRITIKNMFGGNAGQINILPQYVLAGSGRYMVDDKQATDSADVVSLVNKLGKQHNVIIWPEKFLLGVYQAKLSVKLSNQGPLFERTITFFAFPLYILFALTFFIFVLLGIWIKVRKKI